MFKFICKLFTGHDYVETGKKGHKTILKCKVCGHTEYISPHALQFFTFTPKKKN